ncbi:unnamed protein product [Musa banksii]
MVRLTADLIWKSPHFFNAIKERELDLRGNKIAVMENLGATEYNCCYVSLKGSHCCRFGRLKLLTDKVCLL